MRKSIFIFLTFFSLTSVLSAQNTTIIEDINTPKAGQGEVKVMQDESIQQLVAIHHQSTGEGDRKAGVIESGANYEKVKGFKIQVFSGNDQNKSKSQAEYRKSQILGIYPEYEAAITFETPRWRLRVGNFLTREDAELFLQEMKKTFPAFSRDMRIVGDVVKRPTE